MDIFDRKNRMKDKSKLIETENVWACGDGSPFLIEESPNLKVIFDDPNPVPPQRLNKENRDYWNNFEGPEGIRNIIAMAYLRHPNPVIRLEATCLVGQKEREKLMVGNILVQRLADSSLEVQEAAAESIWKRGRGELVNALNFLQGLDESPGDDCNGQWWTPEDVWRALKLLINVRPQQEMEFKTEFMRCWCWRDDRLMSLGLELLAIRSKYGGFLGEGKSFAIKIGAELNGIGGFETMMIVFKAIDRLLGSEAVRDLESAWHEVGGWFA